MACQFIPIWCQIILISAYLKYFKHSIAFGLSTVVSHIIREATNHYVSVGKSVRSYEKINFLIDEMSRYLELLINQMIKKIKSVIKACRD